MLACGGCAPATSGLTTASVDALCGVEGFTRTASDHLIVQLQQPFRVRTVRGVITSEGGDWPPSVVVRVELRNGRMNDIREARTDDGGRFEIRGVAEGRYCFKASAEGWQSVVGTIIVTAAANPADRVSFAMRLGV
jgi:hypothetical protein